MIYENKQIIVIVTGGIAAYKAAYFVRELVKQGAVVRVVMTSSAQQFITPFTFEVLTQQPVMTDMFHPIKAGSVQHIEWAQWADLIFVVPATANLIAKMAQGIADDAALTIILASQAQKVVAPAMNDQMWENPATQRNIQQLQHDNILVIMPTMGFLAEGYEGKGRLPEPVDILAQTEIRLLAQNGALKNQRVLITAGGTREALDPVRFLTNRSSGKMGYALAQAAAEAGASVQLITTINRNVAYSVKTIMVESTQEMYDQVMSHVPDSDIFISAAAVADYRPAQKADQKIKKTDDNNMTINLVKNPDILAEVGHHKRQQYVVGFAAETQNLLAYADAKLKTKGADMLVANDVSRSDIGFSSDDNQVVVLTASYEPQYLPVQSKLDTARAIIQLIAKEYN
ncbi:bifunctional phosphopantothenoylcysteine decarboxylase/phosphopantothenate--cysteine ligase CoaBC [Leuconostoc fallax]|uniref:bifunctional phosphopantothenoylcysteine decarboxylase/phosphopantothenate--cysteine ligase CoaBC n=1 Tax=Leuconostoc fallax TaxID=1251 RepID=UPI002090CF44|nr:bifunctional phosphopantothenoylcysteine decarboxylase/phosphopantothenate--cysteine ligase CoaBC [Leuconostoc fallax]MCO6184129.1 bifunctional phosphopantothenoylcysteine decarboxylase/phosphopantothenate--cysteine ligase CoaBC [Leuconostoc fallax]